MTTYLGVDAGGTKTHALLADEQGLALGLGRAGPGNWEDVGLDGAYRALSHAMHAALDQAGVAVEDVRASAFGLAGLDWPSDEPKLAEVVARLGLSEPRVLVNDSFVALRAGTTKPWGVVVTAGTGSGKAGRNRAGEVARTLGVGDNWGDWGGAWDITRAGVDAVARAYIGLGPSTALSARLVEHAGVDDVAALLEGISREWLHMECASPVVFRAAEDGDAIARAILERAGRALAEGANLVIRKLGMEDEEFELVLAGSLLCISDTPMVDALLREVHRVAPKAKPVRLDAPPAAGGVLLAMEAAGLEPREAVRARLLESARALIDEC